MKRIIEFNFQDDKYCLNENGEIIFSIDTKDLKFNSLDFYNSIYKNKSVNIEIINKIVDDPHKKGSYILSWLNEIVNNIKKEIPEETLYEDSQIVENSSSKIIPLFEFAACAGDGFIIDDNVSHTDIEDKTGKADFAVKISGKSMEPTILDNSIAFIKKEEVPTHNDVGLFVVDGNVTCKRYVKIGRGYKLVPDNVEFDIMPGKNIASITYLGKVIID